MKIFFYLMMLAALLEVHTSCSMGPANCDIFIRIRELQENNPSFKEFFSNTIDKALQDIYQEHRCASMTEMKTWHRDDQLILFYIRAHQKVLADFQAILNKEQARRAAEYFNW